MMAAGSGLAALLFAGACSPPPSAVVTSPMTKGSPSSYGVGVITDTFVDTSRTTAAWGPSPDRPSRTLVTAIFYPSGPPGARPVSGRAPDRTGAPYPLIVFAHGLGAAPDDYQKLLVSWASAGYVVAAPRFPLSSTATPGGPDGGDVVNQPEDMSFVISSVLQATAATSGPLSGLVDPHEIGAAGHSNGAITTLGLVANTCCHDSRVKAAVVMAGTTEGFPSGEYDFSNAPPLLLVHGTADELVPYRSGVLVFNEARGPKGLLTIRGGSHGAAAGLSPPSSATVILSSTEFFDAYLLHQAAAAKRLAGQGRPGGTVLTFDPMAGSAAGLPLPPAPVAHLQASVTPATGLSDGETVTVQWSGYTPGGVVNVLQCSTVDLTSASSAGCDFSNAKILHPDPKGNGSLTLEVVTGIVGNGVCDATHPGCSIVVNNSSSTDPSASRQLPISFAP
ncbi:MAG: neocarzinostatin apoprotein domain-containing protein [Acidimicrobiales bacterium]